jgi:energy-coupling factor transporter ATP-binding protein EcfA2
MNLASAAAIRVENFSYAWPGTDDWTLLDLNLEIHPGECHGLNGASGAGKTTLALAFKNLLPPGRQDGCLRYPSGPEVTNVAVGLVLQNPETQILTESIGAEVAFGLENLCLPPVQMPERVRTALADVGLDLPFDHSTVRLSMGQKYRLLLAAQLVLQPALLILDEPAGQLDESGLQSLARIIAKLKARGMAVLLCEHRLGPLAAVIDRQWRLDASGRLLSAPAGKRPGKPARPPMRQPVDGPPVVEVHGLTVASDDATPAWQNADLVLHRGERALLCAPNGAGKTTLLRCLAGLLKPSCGTIRICGQPLTIETQRNRIGFLFQNPRRQLFETTVFDEVAFGLRRQGVKRSSLPEQVDLVLECCQLTHLATRSPHQLSYGQQHLVALASVLVRKPELLLLDDPLAGLDPDAADRVMDILLRVSEEQGTTLFWTSHHQTQYRTLNHVTFGIAGGGLVRS